ncbi:MAG: CCA tRNA nucleotidyltransferase [Acholeplasma sp.]|jgi:tRNA nucleotidyltransferase (CCA-adding enzyme)|nr:CCA tRNA nucleotidyltransferase [Acholeplasma sp.]
MATIKDALYVLRTLKKNKYEAYFVGGCVRDYLMRKDSNDIDITTNANPYDVMKLFKAKPTGLQYGTVSIPKEGYSIEITTYRKDGVYLDNRHPEEVIPVVTVEEDVQRRDFTINGLVMNDVLQISDFVGGKDDIKNKIIRAIGNPDERFKEDALRILRAVYFQSKLGFQIEKDTRQSMADNRLLLNNIAKERILNETLKVLREPHQLKALKTLDTTLISEVLPGLSKGIKYIVDTQKDPLFIDSFFSLCFSLNGSVPSEWKFSNIARNKYEKVVELVNQKRELTNLDLYTYGLEISILSNKVSFLLGYSAFQKSSLEKRFETLPVKSAMDLKLRASDLLNLIPKKQGAWVQKYLDEMVLLVLEEKLDNTYDALKAYVLKKEASHEK